MVNNDNIRHIYFPIESEEWKFLSFEDDTIGIPLMRDKLIELGFTFSTEEDEAWDAFISSFV